MAILKDLIVLGVGRITSDLYAKTIYEDNVSLSSKYAAYSHTHSQYLTGQDHYSSGITAQTTQALYPIKISASGHITAYGSAVTSLPASDVYSWAKASTKPSYTLDEVSDGSTRKLSNYLPLGGGTMTGRIYAAPSVYNTMTGSNSGVGAIDMQNSDITGINSLCTADLSEAWTESLAFKRSNGNWDTFRAADGTFYFGINNGSSEYTAIHSGNISSQSVNYASSAGAVAWANITGKPSTFTPSEHNHDGRYIRWGGNAANVTAMSWGTLTEANGYTILSHTSSSDGGDWGMCNKGGQIYMQLDGYYYQREGQYRVIDTSEITSYGSRNNSPSKIVTTDGNGFIQAGWINTTSGELTSAPDRIYASNDGYIRYMTPSNLVKYLYPYEANLQWGGRNFSGTFGCIDAAMVPELGTNRMAFIPSNAITVEYSRDGGSTWTDYGLNASSKVNLFNGIGTSFYIGAADSSHIATNQYQVRVNVYTSVGSLYTVLNKFVILVSTNGTGSNWVTIRARLQSNYTAGTDTWTTFAEKVAVSGWSGYNVVNISGLTTYGNTANSQYGHIQFIFGCDVGSTSQYVGMCIYKIFGFGGVGWTIPSTMAKTGHLYSYDSGQNAYFPASVSGSGFIKSGSDASHMLTGDGGHIATSTFAAASHDHTKLNILGQYAYANIATDVPTGAISYKIITSGGTDLDDTQYNVLHIPWTGGDYGTYLLFGANNGKFGVKFKHAGLVREVLTSSSYTDYTVKKDGTGASGSWGISITGNAATATSATSATSATNATNATNARYVIADNNAKDPGYALLQSGSGRADASPAGDTWIFYDNLGGTSTPWGIKHEQAANYISFYGGGNRRNYIDLSTGNFYAAGTIYEAGTALNTRYAALSHTHNYAGSSSAGGAATNAVVNDSNSNSTYRMVWHSGNTLYSTDNVYCNPSTDALVAKSMRSSGNDMYVGSASGSQCHQQYDATNECLKFLFD